jgi:hypothetical protein
VSLRLANLAASDRPAIPRSASVNNRTRNPGVSDGDEHVRGVGGHTGEGVGHYLDGVTLE